jgi:hypothetical protein
MSTVVETRESGFRSSGNDVEGFDGLDVLDSDGFDGDGLDGADDVDAGATGGRDVVVLVVSIVFVKGAIPVGGSCMNKDVGC